MSKILEKFCWFKVLNYISYSLVYFLVEHVIVFQFLVIFNKQYYWMIIPVVLFIVTTYIGKLIGKKDLSTRFLGVISLISLILIFLNINVSIVNVWLSQNFELAAFIIIAIFFINLIVGRNIKHESDSESQSQEAKKLFNLFYINTSKVHEIVMLIDNKIMQTIEREQVSEERLKYNSSFSVGGKDKWSAESGYLKENNSKKRVYENFDVKNTKSIMLRKIYNTIQNNKKEQKKLNLGELTIFDNIELQQENIDDTVMILNILKDSKIKNDPNENFEVNLNKAMDKMLNDFTIDYTFSYKNNRYIIQLPYKSTENFENGYLYNDLQLGKLSIIGIYRGEIDFSKKDSTSSKFLEMMSESYHNELQQHTSPVMKCSNSNNTKQPDNPLEFNYKKLTDTLHLIDVIAIIQELNIKGKK